jgi:hypothetical protein
MAYRRTFKKALRPGPWKAAWQPDAPADRAALRGFTPPAHGAGLAEPRQAGAVGPNRRGPPPMATSRGIRPASSVWLAASTDRRDHLTLRVAKARLRGLRPACAGALSRRSGRMMRSSDSLPWPRRRMRSRVRPVPADRPMGTGWFRAASRWQRGIAPFERRATTCPDHRMATETAKGASARRLRGHRDGFPKAPAATDKPGFGRDGPVGRMPGALGRGEIGWAPPVRRTGATW